MSQGASGCPRVSGVSRVSRVEGRGLHSGAAASVTFERRPGPVAIRAAGVERPVGRLVALTAERATRVGDVEAGLVVGTVEHVFAALAALAIHDGVLVEIAGGEVPLADGGAGAFVAALSALEVPPSAPTLAIARDGEVVVGESRYVFSRRPSDERGAVEVAIDFGDPRLDPRAAWDGDPADFVARIAPARTFALERDVPDLLARGLASHVTRESVVLVAASGVLSAGAPFSADEPARHKLLDLVGDLYLYGGPPRGHVRAERPGHAATHAAVRRAFDEGILSRAR